MAADSFHPPKSEIDALFADLGCEPWSPPFPVGGHLYSRNDSEKLLFVLTWSNFYYSRFTSLIVRELDSPGIPQVLERGQHLPTSDLGSIEFSREDWEEHRPSIRAVVSAILRHTRE